MDSDTLNNSVNGGLFDTWRSFIYFELQNKLQLDLEKVRFDPI